MSGHGEYIRWDVHEQRVDELNADIREAHERIGSLEVQLKGAWLLCDDLRLERDKANARVAELEGILQLVLRERNLERYNDAPVFEPVREVS